MRKYFERGDLGEFREILNRVNNEYDNDLCKCLIYNAKSKPI